MTNASGLARFAALLPEGAPLEDPAGELEDPAGDVAVPVTCVEAGADDVVIAVLVDDFKVAWLRVVFRGV